ncbi:MAG: glutamate-1-semialdehyde 2,1-aminomutase [Acidobacteria bacterium]|nr:glutamate-1-semialdehyde 2,1-aminomutase [Acidobacteriota bacterium]
MSLPRAHADSRLIDLVPGGCHTYSKGADQFPSNAPSTILRGRGARVLGCDGRWYIDWGMGLTSVSLGHAHPEVNAAVTAAIADGVNFVRPSELERRAAASFLDVLGGDMVKFCKNGSVATTAAVKLARAFTGRPLVAVPVEHPFFSYDDWFIGSTEAHLGIPDEHKRLTRTFHYNDLGSLETLVRREGADLACVMLEPVKFDEPAPGFLDGVRALCRRNGTVLVFDETVSGLKWAMRGGQEYFGVEPDLSVWGKGLANGFSACALSGRRDIMALGGSRASGDRVFLVSTTHGAESAGLAAMIRTLEIFEGGEVIAANWRRGADLKARLNAAIAAADLGGCLHVHGYPCLLLIVWSGLPEREALAWKTLLFQELVREGVLFQGVMYPTPAHDQAACDETVAAFEAALPRVAAAWRAGSTEGVLEGPAIKPVFRRFQECAQTRCGRIYPDAPKAPCCLASMERHV